MPRTISAALPAWAERAHDILGARSTLAVLAVLVTCDKPIAHRDLAQDAGLSVQTTTDAMRRLEDAGLVTGSLPRAQRPSTVLRWSLERARLDELVHDLTVGLSPNSSTGNVS